MSERAPFRRLAIRLIEPLVGTSGKNCWFDAVFYTISEIQLFLMILSIAYFNSTNSSSENAQTEQTFPRHDIVFQVQLSSTLSATDSVISFLYFFFVLLFLILNAYFSGSKAINYTCTGLMTMHRDFIGPLLNQVYLFCLSEDGLDVGELIKLLCLMILNIGIGLFVSMYCFSYCDQFYLLGLKRSRLHIYNFVFKLIATACEINTDGTTNQAFRMAIWFIYLLLNLLEIYHFPFYSYEMNIYFALWKSIQLGCWIAVGIRWMTEKPPSFAVFVTIVLFFLIASAITSLIKWRINTIFQFNDQKLTNPLDLSTKFIAVDYIYRKGNSLSSKRTFDIEQLLFFSKVQNLEDKALTANDLEIHYLTTITRLNRLIFEKFSKNHHLVLQKVHYEINSGIKISNESIYAIDKLIRNSDLLDQLRALKIRDQINQTLTTHMLDKNGLDFGEIANFYHQKNKFVHLIRDSMKEYMQFWESYFANPRAYSLFLKASDVNARAQIIDKLWNDLKDKYERNIRLEIKLYLIYLLYIRCAPYTAQKVSKLLNITSLHEIKNKELAENGARNISGYGSISILATMKSAFDLTILSISREITALGYEESELFNQPIEVLMPNFYKHKNFLKLIEESTQEVTVKNFSLLLQEKGGYIAPFKCLASPIIHKEALCYLIILTPADIQGEGLVVSDRGIVLGGTKRISHELKLKSTESKDRFINEFCMTPWNKMKATASKNLLFEDLNTIKQITSILDIDITTEDHTTSYKCFITMMLEKNKFVIFLESARRATTYYFSHKLDPQDSAADFSDCEERSKVNIVRDIKEEHTDKLLEDVDGDSFHHQIRKALSEDSLSNNGKSKRHDGVENSVGSVQASASAENRRLERTIYSSFTYKRDYIFQYGIFFQITVCIIIIIYFTFYSSEKLDQLPEIFLITKHLFDRDYNLWVWGFWDSETINLILAGILDHRLGMTQEEYLYFCISADRDNAIAILAVDQYISSMLPSLETETYHRFNQPIRVKARENTSHIINLTFLEWDRAYSNSLLRRFKYASLPVSALNPNDIDVYFTSKNVLDDHYIVQTDLQYAINDDIQLKLDKLSNVTSIVLGVICAMAAYVIVWLVQIELRYYWKKRIFLEAMFQIKEEEVRPELAKIKFLVDEMMNLNDLENKIEKIQDVKHQNAKVLKDVVKKSRRGGSMVFSNKIIFLVAVILVEQILVIVLASTIAIRINASKDNIGRVTSKSIQVNIFYEQFGVLFLSLYEYIQGNNPTLRNNDYTEEVKKDLEILSASTNVYYSLLSDLDKDLVQTVVPILNGDLCENVLGGGDACAGNVSARVANGLLGTNAFIIDAVTSIKDAYDRSNKTLEAKVEVFYMDKYVDIEWVYWIYVSQSTKKLQKAMNTQVLRTIESAKTTMKNTIIVFSVLFVVFFLIVWRIIWRNILKERRLVDNMIKMIPQSVAMNNFYIRNFIFKISKDK